MASTSTTAPPPSPFDLPPIKYPIETQRMYLHDDVQEYIRTLELSTEWLEVENRPWSNENNRYNLSGARGYDYVQYDPRVKMRFFWNEATQTLAGSVFWDNRCEGPPNGVYGGSIMVVFDEILAYPCWRSGIPAVTANVNLNIRRMIPLHTSARFESKIVKSEGRKRFIEAKIITADGSTVYADAKGLWIVSLGGIGGSSATHGETIEYDLAVRKANDMCNKLMSKNTNDVTSNVLLFPMNSSVNVKGAVTPYDRLDSLPAPCTNSILPYQHITHLNYDVYPQRNTSILNAQVKSPRSYETGYQQPTFLAKL